jgi:hypothetical protein
MCIYSINDGEASHTGLSTPCDNPAHHHHTPFENQGTAANVQVRYS